MLALIGTFLPLVLKIAPFFISLFVDDKKARQQALDDFKAYVAQHSNDGLLSGSLRAEAKSQTDDLKAMAATRDAAVETATAAALAQTGQTGPVVSPVGQVGPTGNLGAPKTISPVPHVKGQS